MTRQRRPLGTWGVVAVILALGAWTGGLAYAQMRPVPAVETAR